MYKFLGTHPAESKVGGSGVLCFVETRCSVVTCFGSKKCQAIGIVFYMLLTRSTALLAKCSEIGRWGEAGCGR